MPADTHKQNEAQAQTRTLRSPSNETILHTLGISLVALLMLAFYLVCSHQVRLAESRRTAFQVQQTAFSDCLQYVVGSTIGACVSRLGAQPVAAPQPVPEATAELVVAR